MKKKKLNQCECHECQQYSIDQIWNVKDMSKKVIQENNKVGTAGEENSILAATD